MQKRFLPTNATNPVYAFIGPNYDVIMCEATVTVSATGDFDEPPPLVSMQPAPPLNLSELKLPSCADLLRLLLEDGSFNAEIQCTTTTSAAVDTTIAQSNSPSQSPSIPVLHAHRSILSARSPVFEAMFDSPLTEGQSGIIMIDDVTYGVMREVLHFIYLNEFTQNMDVVLDSMCEPLIYAAVKYEISGLIGLCEQHFIRRIDNNNALTMHQVASTYHLTNLLTASDKYIEQHDKDILRGMLIESEGI